MRDILDFVVETYKDEIKEVFGDTELTISFFSGNHELVDEIKPLGINKIVIDGFKFQFIQDYTISTNGDTAPITDFSVCLLEGYQFIKVVTPFTMERAYDFIIGKTTEMVEILQILKEREVKKNFKFDSETPIIGHDFFTEIEEDTIKFLMNDDFRDYCKKHHIKLKRGIVLEGKPGTGKTMTLRWLRNIAEANNIVYRQFKSIKEFMESTDEYYQKQKKIFVFEDFDAALADREKGDTTPNQILSTVLNTLEGVEDIDDVVSIFTTNHIEVFDSAFLRPGRIDKVFNYELPKHDEFLAFFEAYIPEEKIYHLYMAERLAHLGVDVSYAILKGICDDINIWKFSKVGIQEDDVKLIIEQKLQGANKDKKIEETSKYVL